MHHRIKSTSFVCDESGEQTGEIKYSISILKDKGTHTEWQPIDISLDKADGYNLTLDDTRSVQNQAIVKQYLIDNNIIQGDSKDEQEE